MPSLMVMKSFGFRILDRRGEHRITKCRCKMKPPRAIAKIPRYVTAVFLLHSRKLIKSILTICFQTTSADYLSIRISFDGFVGEIWSVDMVG